MNKLKPSHSRTTCDYLTKSKVRETEDPTFVDKKESTRETVHLKGPWDYSYNYNLLKYSMYESVIQKKKKEGIKSVNHTR